jgi:hypothetical protein
VWRELMDLVKPSVENRIQTAFQGKSAGQMFI